MQKKSIYKYASELGVPMGLYLTMMSACVLCSIKIPALPMLLLPLIIGFPVLLWFLMKKLIKEAPMYNKFSSLWLGGLYTVIFGTLICMFLSSIYIVFVEPNFVNLYVGNALTALESSPMATEYENSIALMRDALSAHILPNGMEFATTMAWFTCFCGSLVSLVLAFIISSAPKKTARAF